MSGSLIRTVAAVVAVAVGQALALVGPGIAMAHGPQAHAQKGNAGIAVRPREQKDWGIAGDAKAVRRTVVITMTDQMRFKPDALSFTEGETVRLVIRNQGAMQHELVLGTKAELDAHAALMLKHPNMEHDEPYMAHVAQGRSGEIVWTFNRTGDFHFACLIAGHYQAGMVGTLAVRPARRASASAP